MNIGQIASGIFRMTVYVDGELRHMKQSVALSQGENKWIPYALRLNEGANKVEIRLDDLGQVNEENRSEEHTSELQSLMRISYAVFCLKKKIKDTTNIQT